MKKLTVFTPTYNRKHLLPRLYESLKNQLDKNFIWMIIDDGSTDGTKDLIEEWQRENKLQIEYFYKENEGMHSAHNMAYEKISTQWNTCVDSDDIMPNDAVKIINQNTANDPGEEYYGFVGLDADFSGHILGKRIPPQLTKVQMMELEGVHGINGDKKLIFKTQIMSSLPPYPVFVGEKLVPLSYKSLEAEKRNLFLKPINHILCLVEYQDDGSTKNMLKQYRQHPRGFAFMRVAKLNSNGRLKEQFKSAVHLNSGTFFTGDIANMFKTKNTMLVLATLPAGILLNLYIRFKTRKKQ